MMAEQEHVLFDSTLTALILSMVHCHTLAI
jgi:hypothetical protein